MNKIAVTELKAGQCFSQPVFVDGDSLFVAEGLPIKQRDIERLVKWGVEYVESAGDPVPQDHNDALNTFFLRAFQTAAMREVTRIYEELRSDLVQLFGHIRAAEEPASETTDDLVERLLQLITTRANDVVQYMLYGMQGETGEVESALNTAAIAAIVGRAMQFSAERLTVLTTAALLHDVGMLRLSATIVTKQGALTTEERRVVQTHPIHSYQVIIKELGMSEPIGLAALQHQERWDGKGYPQRLTGERIGLEARIIAVVASFVAMVSNRPHRNPMVGYTAIRNLLVDNGTRFDPDVLKTFIHVLGIYPIGSIVQLSDGSIARVLENRSTTILKPMVKVIIGAQGEEYVNDDGPSLDLAQAGQPFIGKAVDAMSLAAQVKHRN